MNRDLVMETAAQACACGKHNMPVVAVKAKEEGPLPAWNIGYVCSKCGLHEIFFVAEMMLGTTHEVARKLVAT